MGMIKPYRDELVQQIKEVGQQLINDADKMIGEGAEFIVEMDIIINLGRRTDEIEYPEIETSVIYGVRDTLKRWSE